MSGEGGWRKRYLIAAVVLLSLVVLGPVVASSGGPNEQASGSPETFADARDEGRAHIVAPHPNSTMAIWPYTSRRKSVESATLPINMVVLADADLVRSTLIHRPDAHWEDQRRGLNGSASTTNSSDDESTLTPVGTVGRPNSSLDQNTTASNGTAVTPNSSDDESTPTQTERSSPQGSNEDPLFPSGINSTGAYWSEASGSNRYTYIRSGEPESGRWIGETDQLHDGDYFGARYHIRFYEVPDGENTWTALQVHREHFDWFRLRHTVGTLPRAQHYVESQFYDQWYVEELNRKRFNRGGILNSDGWATVVDIRYPDLLRQELAAMTLLSGLAVVGTISGWASSVDRRKLRQLMETAPVSPRIVLLALPISAIPLLVRVGSIAVERSGFVNSPDVVAAVFYPFLAIGLPVCAYFLARGLDSEEAFFTAFVALGLGFLLDYSYLEIPVLPIEVIVHRAILLVAIGIVAVAGTDRPDESAIRDSTLLAGGGLWIVALLWTLFLW